MLPLNNFTIVAIFWDTMSFYIYNTTYYSYTLGVTTQVENASLFTY